MVPPDEVAAGKVKSVEISAGDDLLREENYRNRERRTQPAAKVFTNIYFAVKNRGGWLVAGFG